jgi:hypothetical protein
MTFAKTKLLTAALLLAAPIVPAAAQPVPAAPPAPPAWSVATNEARGAVTISSTAKGGVVQFAGGCRRGAEPGLTGAFANYRGTGLRTDGQIDTVAFYARGEEWQDAFAVQLRYSAATQSWGFVHTLSPVFFASFSRGATLAVVNSRNEEIFTFDLTGSTAAVKAMRTVCEIEFKP